MRGRASGLRVRTSSIVRARLSLSGVGARFACLFIEELRVVMLGDLRLDESDFVAGEPIPLVEFGVGPWLVERQIRHKGVHISCRVLGYLSKRNQEPNNTRP